MSPDVIEAEALSDSQIEQLLQEAETRLKSNSGAVATADPDDELTFELHEDKPELAKRKPIPKLQHGLEKSSYIRDQHGVAKVRPELLATKEQQTLADQLRSVPVQEGSKKEVCLLPRYQNPCMRKLSQYS